MEEEPELVTIALYRDAMEADLAKGRLDSAGIPNFLVGENAALLYGTGLGGLQLQVRPRDEEDARVILSDPGSLGASSGDFGKDETGSGR